MRNYALVTGCYWVFTITDGAMRMLVLLFLHQQGRSPLEIASLFLLYEALGVATNAVAGRAGHRFGLKALLVAGLALQIVACLVLEAASPGLGIPVAMAAQALSGIAKDLTKTGAKSYVRLVVPEGDHRRLFRWVSVLTGSKNALKGLGFFVGALLLASLGFGASMLAMAAALGAALIPALLLLAPARGRPGADAGRGRALVSADPRINRLALARLFLFGSRDAWFVLALPLFLQESLGWSQGAVGAFLALWIVGYGGIQAAAPSIVGGRGGEQPGARRLSGWTGALILPLALLAALLMLDRAEAAGLTASLALFGFVFAANSSLHSFLIVRYARSERVALEVGFYYMANAAGRLFGTLASGALYQLGGGGRGGLLACVLGSAALVLCALGATLALRGREARAAAEIPAATPRPH